MREQRLPDTARRELRARIADDADANDGDIDLVAIDLRDAADSALRNAAFAEHAIDTRNDLRAVGQRHGARVELLEVTQPEVHTRLVSLPALVAPAWRERRDGEPPSAASRIRCPLSANMRETHAPAEFSVEGEQATARELIIKFSPGG